jgi:Protein of unknown function (DUF3168)
MSPMIYRVPFLPFRIAATNKIMGDTGLYGTTGTLTGSIATPPSKKLRAIYDQRAVATPVLPYFVWGAKTGTPDPVIPVTTFHSAGSELGITGHIYSDRMYSTDEADELADAIVTRFHRRPLSIAGVTTITVAVEVIDIVSDPIGQHAILQFTPRLTVPAT